MVSYSGRGCKATGFINISILVSYYKFLLAVGQPSVAGSITYVTAATSLRGGAWKSRAAPF